MKKLLSFCILLLLIVLLLWPQLHPEAIFNLEYALWLDMTFHAIGYLVITSIILNLYANAGNWFLLLFAIILFSIMIEWMQIYVPGRSFDLADLIGNILGIVAAYGVYVLRSCLRNDVR